MEGEAKRSREARHREVEKELAMVRLEVKEGARKQEELQDAKKQVG